jgi:hypothetical protein
MTVSCCKRIRGPASWLLGLCLSANLLLATGCRHGAPGPPQPAASEPGPRETLPATDPLAFLNKCLERYDHDEIQGYRLVLQKQERIGDVLKPIEVIEVSFRARPYSVFMHWHEGARGITSALYVQGENDGKVLVHPTGVLGWLHPVAPLDPKGTLAREASRYNIAEFGFKKMLERTLADWKAAREKGTLHAEYLGTRKLPAAGDRLCYVLRRTLRQPDAEGIQEATVYLDVETWFPIGTVLHGEGGKLIGEYFYRDIHLNPTFAPDQFTSAALKR